MYAPLGCSSKKPSHDVSIFFASACHFANLSIILSHALQAGSICSSTARRPPYRYGPGHTVRENLRGHTDFIVAARLKVFEQTFKYV